MIGRRGFLGGLAAALAAPVVLPSNSLMDIADPLTQHIPMIFRGVPVERIDS
jgi:hypothetical protein